MLFLPGKYGFSSFCALFSLLLAQTVLHGSSDEKTWLTGNVLATDSERFLIHLDYPNDSAAGTSPTWFAVNPAIIAHVQKGDQVRGRLIRSDGRWRLEDIAPYNPQNDHVLEQAGRLLRRDTLMRGRTAERQIGERIPQFALIDQQGTLVQHSDLHGHYVVLNFIFSRCPQPDMCPASTRRMIRLQEESLAIPLNNLRLYSISLDPEYDTPYILREYGTTWKADFKRFRFLTGTDAIVQDLLKQFGIATRDSNGTIDHTMSTVLIAPDGTILHKVAGSAWSVLDFITRIQDHQVAHSTTAP